MLSLIIDPKMASLRWVFMKGYRLKYLFHMLPVLINGINMWCNVRPLMPAFSSEEKANLIL